MTTLLLDGCETVVADALRECSPSAERLGRWDWRMRLDGGADMEARIRDGRLCMSVPLDGRKFRPSARSLLKLLTSNSKVPGGGKFVLLQDRSAALRVEIPLEQDGNLSEQILDGYAGLQVTMKRFRAPWTRDSPTREREEEGCDLRQLCGEAGWPFAERASGLAVPLEVPGLWYQALLREDCGEVRAVVTLLEWDRLPDQCIRAIAVLLLTAGCFLQMARPIARSDGATRRYSAGFEVRLPGEPTTMAVDHALSSLSVGCHSCGREVTALQDERIAAAYLAIRGWSA